MKKTRMTLDDEVVVGFENFDAWCWKVEKNRVDGYAWRGTSRRGM